MGVGVGGRVSKLKILFSQKPACASQIVSHILRMWRLTSDLKHATSKPTLQSTVLIVAEVYI